MRLPDGSVSPGFRVILILRDRRKGASAVSSSFATYFPGSARSAKAYRAAVRAGGASCGNAGCVGTGSTRPRSTRRGSVFEAELATTFAHQIGARVSLKADRRGLPHCGEPVRD